MSARALWLAAAALVLVVSTTVAFTQRLRPDPYTTPPISDPAWWLTPVERNAFARLPVIVADLNDVFVLPGTETMWVVGEAGMIAHSRDGGRSWKRQSIAPDPTAPTAPSAPRAPAVSSRPGLVAVAEAQQKGLTTVPDIVGRSVGEAAEILGKNDLRLEGIDSKQPLRPQDIVATQKPAAGAPIPAGSAVLVDVSPPRPAQAQQQSAPAPSPPQQQRTKPGPAPAPSVKPEAPPLPARPSLHAVHFVDERRGWAVGEAGTIVVTSDGGESWQRQASGTGAALRALHVLVDGQRAWVVGTGGTILATADGGQRWLPQSSPTESSLESITFAADGRRGWIVGRDGTILVTSSGGERWERRGGGVIADLHGLHFDADGRRGWAVGDGGLILATDDGGTRWQRQISNVDANLTSIRFIDGRRGWIGGDRGTLLATVDSGRRWEAQDSSTRAGLRAIRAETEGARAWVVGAEGTVLATQHGGVTPTARTAGRRAMLGKIHADRDGQRAWVVGGDGTFLAMSGGGAWELQPTATRLALLGVHVLPDGLRGSAVGEDGVVLTTTDGGRRFDRQTTLDSDLLTSVRFTPDGRSGWITSLQGIFATANGSAQWVRRHGAGAFHDLSLANDGRRGWAVGGDGVIVTLAGGEVVGQLRIPGVSNDLMALYMTADGERGWAVGADGAIVGTTGNNSWQRRQSGTRALLLGTDSVDGIRGWTVGWDGTILVTTDGGQQWRAQRSGTNVPLYGIRFAADGKRGWAVGWGVILTTVDGGDTWTPVTHAAFPAPWYYASWLLALGLLVPALRRPDPKPVAEPSIADVLVSDKPLELGEPDALGFGHVARGLSRFLRNEQTKPPLTIAITGPWGSGKSSLMNLVRGDLRGRGFRPVWFNAWHHQKEEHLLATLLQNILAQAVPGWLSREGLAFRARLLWYRSGRRWRLVLPVIVLVSGAAGFFTTEHPARWQVAVGRSATVVERMVGIVTPLFPTGVKDSLDKAKEALREVFGEGTASSAIPTGVAVVVLLFMVWRGITAFGVNPADLMATVSGRFKRRQLEAKVGFRHEFAQQFRDVTRALHPRTMLILIDDLDRCRPENVLEVLEAVNFLVSSGDCFVIIGMELERVRRCVGLGFKDVAGELTDREEAQTAAGTPGLTADGDEGKRRRAVFAQQYLEKLINIEVPVPKPTQSQAARVIAPEAPVDDALGRWRALGARVRDVGRTATPVAALFMAVVGGFGAAVLMWPVLPPAPLVADAVAPRTPDGGGSKPAPPTGEKTPAPAPSERTVLPSVIIGGVAAAPSRWFATGPLAGFVLAAVVAFLRRPPIVIKDSDEFTRALTAWHPLVFTEHSTPRSAKRFLNRVRYYAMRQRDLPEERRFDRVMAWAAARLGRKTTPAAVVAPTDVIPEHILVGLSAIEHCHPKWLAEPRLFKDPEGFLADQRLPGLQVSSLGLGRDLDRYREPFARLSAGIRA